MADTIKKKKILYVSDGSYLNSGFGQVSRRLLSSWYKTKKYEIVHLCQGSQEHSNPEFLKYPWKCIGTIPHDQNVVNRMNSDQLFGRNVSYGELMIEKIVLDFKPDIIFGVNDMWGNSDIFSKFKFWNKTNCITWETFDSLPLHKPSLDNIDKLKNAYCWSTFAEDEFKRLGHNNVKTQFPPTNTTDYYPLDKAEKLKYKLHFGIQDKKFIVSYVFRNQLRKQSWTIIEGYSILEKNHPEIAKDVWIHFHTHLKEGWDYKRFCAQYNVDYHRVLFSWICKNCRELEIKADDDNKVCKHCKAKDSQDTCNVSFGATTEQMNQIYNIGDCFALVANSGATEMPGIEAMSCGIPLATIDYTYGHDFVKNDFVYNLGFSKYVELGTQFVKATPSGRDISKFIVKIYNSKKEQLKEICEKSRQWILDNFDSEVVSKKWQGVIDNLPEITWDFKYEQDEAKNPDFPFPEISDPGEFIKSLYKNILKVTDIKENDEGLLYWLQAIKNGKSKQEIHSYFSSIGFSDNEKMRLSKGTSLSDLLEENGKKNFIIVCKEAYGDCLMLTALLKSFRESYPIESWNLYIGCEPKYKEVFDGNPYVTKVLDYNSDMESEIKMTGIADQPAIFDGYNHLTVCTQRHLSYLTNNNIGLDLENKFSE